MAHRLGRYELWLNGKLIKDYSRLGDAQNAFSKTCRKYGRGASVSIIDVESDYKTILDEDDFWPDHE